MCFICLLGRGRKETVPIGNHQNKSSEKDTKPKTKVSQPKKLLRNRGTVKTQETSSATIQKQGKSLAYSSSRKEVSIEENGKKR